MEVDVVFKLLIDIFKLVENEFKLVNGVVDVGLKFAIKAVWPYINPIIDVDVAIKLLI
jgi:hypothetical protein